MHEIVLMGLDGSNLLGFLAALGALRVLSDGEDARMNWRLDGKWTPSIWHATIETQDALLLALEEKVCGASTVNAAWTVADDLTLKRSDFRDGLLACWHHSSFEKRSELDFLAAFGSEAMGAGPKKEQIADTEYRTMSGAGNQHFLKSMRELAENTALSHLRRALFERWDYADDRPSLRWAPSDYRPHALRAEDPSSDPIKTMRGANRLAIEALPLFPTSPAARNLQTVAFEDRNREAEITWPIWLKPIEIGTVASALAMEVLQSEEINAITRKHLNRREIVQAFRAKRFTEGQFRNFTPALALL